MLTFGYRYPEGTKAAWGARAILDARGKERYVDFLHDRQSFVGYGTPEGEALKSWLNEEGAYRKLRDAADNMFKTYKINSDQREEYVLYEDEKGIVLANPNASYGYLYVSAYLK